MEQGGWRRVGREMRRVEGDEWREKGGGRRLEKRRQQIGYWSV